MRLLLMFVGILLMTGQAWAATPVALQVYLEDGFAMDARSADLFEQIFKDLRPDVRFKRVSFSANDPDLEAKLKQTVSQALQPDEVLSHLLLDTHGHTADDQTFLRHMGSFGSSGPDPQFAEIFSPFRERAADNLQIILNSCSTLCGDEVSIASRATALLKFFSAENGSLYGSRTPEVSQAYDYAQFFKWKYLVPDAKMFATVTSIGAALLGPLWGYEIYQQTGEWTQVMQAAPTIAGVAGATGGLATSTLKPLYQWLASRTFANRGWFIVLENGVAKPLKPINKRKDLFKIISCADQL